MTVGRLLKGPENLFPQLASYYEQRDPTRTQDLLSKLEQFWLFKWRDFYIYVSVWALLADFKWVGLCGNKMMSCTSTDQSGLSNM